MSQLKSSVKTRNDQNLVEIVNIKNTLHKSNYDNFNQTYQQNRFSIPKDQNYNIKIFHDK